VEVDVAGSASRAGHGLASGLLISAGCASGLCQAFSVTPEKGGHDADASTMKGIGKSIRIRLVFKGRCSAASSNEGDGRASQSQLAPMSWVAVRSKLGCEGDLQWHILQ